MGLGNKRSFAGSILYLRTTDDINKQDLLKVADVVFRCGLASGFSGDEIIAFAKHTAPTKDLDWIAALMSRANQRKGCPVEGGGGGTVDDGAVGCGGLRGGTARD